MRPTGDPPRLTEAGSDAVPELAAAIRGMRGQRSSPEQVDALARVLAERIGVATVSGSGGSLGLHAKWLLGGLVAALGLGSLWHFDRGEPGVAAAGVKTVASARPQPSPQSEARATALPPVEAARAIAAVQPARPERARVAPPPRKRADAATAAAAPEQELVLLRRSQAALDQRDATLALALAEEHERAHARGIFVQERELLAIEALLRLGRRDEAIGRAEQFVRRFPESPHAVRVTAVLARTPAREPPPQDSAGL